MIGTTPTQTEAETADMASDSLSDEPTRLDVREIDGEPFDDIVTALEALGPDERLRLINSFEPTPLYGVLEDRGFTYETTELGPQEWRIDITYAE